MVSLPGIHPALEVLLADVVCALAGIVANASMWNVSGDGGWFSFEESVSVGEEIPMGVYAEAVELNEVCVFEEMETILNGNGIEFESLGEFG